jgi:hypothetical protein
MKSLSCLPNLSSLQVLMDLEPEHSYDDELRFYRQLYDSGLSKYLQEVHFVRQMGQPPTLQTIYVIATRSLPKGEKPKAGFGGGATCGGVDKWFRSGVIGNL